jgi:hypothetical protein
MDMFHLLCNAGDVDEILKQALANFTGFEIYHPYGRTAGAAVNPIPTKVQIVLSVPAK